MEFLRGIWPQAIEKFTFPPRVFRGFGNRNRVKVSQGNFFMLQSLLIAETVSSHGGFFILEHPRAVGPRFKRRYPRAPRGTGPRYATSLRSQALHAGRFISVCSGLRPRNQLALLAIFPPLWHLASIGIAFLRTVHMTARWADALMHTMISCWGIKMVGVPLLRLPTPMNFVNTSLS